MPDAVVLSILEEGARGDDESMQEQWANLLAKGFNRHGTLHGDLASYGEAEMLAGLLLLVAWVRELSWWAEHEPASLTDASLPDTA